MGVKGLRLIIAATSAIALAAHGPSATAQDDSTVGEVVETVAPSGDGSPGAAVDASSDPSGSAPASPDPTASDASSSDDDATGDDSSASDDSGSADGDDTFVESGEDGSDAASEDGSEDGGSEDGGEQTAELSVAPGEPVVVDAPDTPVEDLRVSVDDRILENDFYTVEDGSLKVTPPFRTEGLHVLKVVGPEGDELISLTFSIDSKSFLKNVSVDVSGTLSTEQTQVVVSETDPEQHTDRYNGTGNVTITAERGKWTLSSETDIEGADIADRGPFEDHKIDASSVKVLAGFTGETYSFEGKLGDVDSEGRNELVSSGLSGRGTTFNVRAFDERLKFDVGVVSGVSVIGYRDGGRAPDNKDFTFGADVAYDVFSETPVTLTLGISTIHTKRRQSFGFGESGIDEVEENTVFGGMIDVTALDGRLAYSGRFAETRYAVPTEDDVTGDVFRQVDRAIGQTHSLSFDALTEDVTLSFASSFERVEPLYNSLEGGGSADTGLFSISADAAYEDLSVSISFSRTRSNIDDIVTELSTQSFSLDISGSYSLESLELGAWAPDSIDLSWSRSTTDPIDEERYLSVTGFSGEDLSRSTDISMDVTGSWAYNYGENASGDTSVTASVTWTDDRTPSSDAADSRSNSFGVSQSFSYSWVSLSGGINFIFDRQFDPEADTTSFGADWNASASLSPDGLPKLDFELSFGRNTSDTLGEFGSRSTDRNDSASVSLTFDPVFDRIGLPEGLSATLSYKRTRSVSDSFDGFKSDISDERFLLNFSADL